MVNIRYIKILIDSGINSANNGLLSIEDLRVFKVGDATNYALNKTATASSEYNYASIHNTANKAVDGNGGDSYTWATADNTGKTNLNGSEWLKVDLGSIIPLSYLTLSTRFGNGYGAITDYRVLISTDDILYTTVKTLKGLPAAMRTDAFYFITPKTAVSDMNIGDIIACNYAASSNSFGTFSQLGTSTAVEIPIASTATPNGTFYFVMVGYDSKGRKKLIADRNIQHSISWDTLDNVGVPSGSGLPITIDGSKYIMRLLTGGISAADTDNEWDKIIVGSTLNGLINAGDNAMWNWDTVTRTATLNTGSTSGARVHRGYATASSGTVSSISTSMASSSAINSNGFRPMLLVDPQIRSRYVAFKNISDEFYARQ